jgi:DNA-binding response OmpR family regulator
MAQGRLLVLDDDATVGQMLVMAAQTAGFEARCCADLPAFITHLQACPQTHVVVDLNLPESSIEQVMQQLSEVGCRAQVIVCSGAALQELQAALSLARALGLRTAGVLAKPFRLAELRALLQAPD